MRTLPSFNAKLVYQLFTAVGCVALAAFAWWSLTHEREPRELAPRTLENGDFERLELPPNYAGAGGKPSYLVRSKRTGNEWVLIPMPDGSLLPFPIQR